MTFRPLAKTDIPALQSLLDRIDLFPSGMLPDMAAPALAGHEAHLFLVADAGDGPCGFAYLRAEEMTEGVWNMLALGVAAERQRGGFGAGLVRFAEDTLRARSARLVLVDTSGTDGFAAARQFYRSIGYVEVARIPEYWGTADAKVTFAKVLDGSAPV